MVLGEAGSAQATKGLQQRAQLPQVLFGPHTPLRPSAPPKTIFRSEVERQSSTGTVLSGHPSQRGTWPPTQGNQRRTTRTKASKESPLHSGSEPRPREAAREATAPCTTRPRLPHTTAGTNLEKAGSAARGHSSVLVLSSPPAPFSGRIYHFSSNLELFLAAAAG